MADIEKLDGESLDIVEQNIEQLKELFPSVFTEGKIQFNKLEELLGNYVVEDEDHYNFTWHGKRKAGRLAQTPSTGTLRPCKEESVDWDTTENIFIEGDNLEVLKLLQKSYHRQVKMIYIDPPYNTGNDFVYEDDFKDGVKNYLEVTGQLDGEGKKVGTNTSAAGRYHTNWLNMMYPRLKLARNLLKDDGIVFISIDDNEQSNLKKLCDEVFGEENFIASFTRLMKTGGAKGRFYTPNVEFIVVYAKNINEAEYFRTSISPEQIKSYYNKVETEGERKGEKYGEERMYLPSLAPRPNQRYWIECPDGSFAIPPGKLFPKIIEEGEKITPTSEDGCWRWTYETYKKAFDENRIIFKETKTSALVDEEQKQSKYNIYFKLWLKDQQEKGKVPSNFINKWENRQSSAELKELNIPFDFAKPTELLKYLVEIVRPENNDLILDFFAGSGSLGHAAMKFNVFGDKDIRYLCVQLPEETDTVSEAYKAGFKNIAEISKERLRRAAKKIRDENPDYDGDLGFKVFKLDSSNIKRWDADFDTLEQDLVEAADYLVEGRSDEDVLYELCLKLGLDLSVKIEEKTIAEEKLFVLGRGYLVVCLSDNVTMDVVNGIGDLKDKLAPEEGMRVVFKDDGFKDDVIKTNALQTLKRFGITDIKSL